MKAQLIRDYGGPAALELAELADPMPGPDEIVAEIHAASVNPIDWKIREGLLRSFFDVRLPHVLGRDFSGVVVAVGANVGDLRPDDAVFGVGNPLKPGTHAQKIAIDPKLVARKPRSLSHVAAAALGVAGLSALAALETTAPVKAGDRVLVHAGAGGVGHLALQYARKRGAHVIATARAENHDFVKACGAHEAFDHAAGDFATAIRDCDIVLDSLGGEVHQRSMACLRPGGTLVYLVAAPLPKAPPRPDINVLGAQVRGGRAALERLSALAVEGVLKPHVAATFPLERAGEAYAASQTGRSRGKLVLTMR
jgi:NADPH:quinone reductase-like Zn-dependent oxidoreductase